MVSQRLFMCCLMAIGSAAVVQALPANRQEQSMNTALPRKVYWANESWDWSPEVFRNSDEAGLLVNLKKMNAAEKIRKGEQCQPIITAGSSTLEKDLSLCPWVYHTEDVDEHRVPEVIPQALCKCSKCRFSRLTTFQGPAGFGALRETSTCREFYENRQVLRRAIPGDNTSPYVAYNVPVSVACVCQKHIS